MATKIKHTKRELDVNLEETINNLYDTLLKPPFAWGDCYDSKKMIEDTLRKIADVYYECGRAEV